MYVSLVWFEGGGMLGWEYNCACVTVEHVYSVCTQDMQSNCGIYINQPTIKNGKVQIRPTIYASLNLFGKSKHTMVSTFFVRVTYKYLK